MRQWPRGSGIPSRQPADWGMLNTIDSTRRLSWDSDDGFLAITPSVVSSFVAARDDFDDPDLDEDLDESDHEESEDEEWNDEEWEEGLEDEDLGDDEL